MVEMIKALTCGDFFSHRSEHDPSLSPQKFAGTTAFRFFSDHERAPMGRRLAVQDLTRGSLPCEGCGVDVDQSWGKVRYCTRECGRNVKSRQRYYALPKAERVALKYTAVPKQMIPCELCQTPITKRGDEDRRFCGPCGTGKGHVARARRYGVPVETVRRQAVFARDGWVCQICYRPVDKGLSWPHAESASLDHVVPLSRGGAHSEANTQLAHLGCNTGKGARS